MRILMSLSSGLREALTRGHLFLDMNSAIGSLNSSKITHLSFWLFKTTLCVCRHTGFWMRQRDYSNPGTFSWGTCSERSSVFSDLRRRPMMTTMVWFFRTNRSHTTSPIFSHELLEPRLRGVWGALKQKYSMSSGNDCVLEFSMTGISSFQW